MQEVEEEVAEIQFVVVAVVVAAAAVVEFVVVAVLRVKVVQEVGR